MGVTQPLKAVVSSRQAGPPYLWGKRSASSNLVLSHMYVTGQQQAGPPCLWGAVTFGDNVEDEWYVTWLLTELTRGLPGLAARVWDEDGDFMLIEVRGGIQIQLTKLVGIQGSCDWGETQSSVPIDRR
jgi:hypothetical protein